METHPPAARAHRPPRRSPSRAWRAGFQAACSPPTPCGSCCARARDAVGDVARRPLERRRAGRARRAGKASSQRASPAGWAGSSAATSARSTNGEFFGISHEEAELDGPAAPAVAGGGVGGLRARGSADVRASRANTGVFAGLSNPDHAAYAARLAGGGGPYLLTGNLFGTAAGRISHALGLCGPSMALDSPVLVRSRGRAPGVPEPAARGVRHGAGGRRQPAAEPAGLHPPSMSRGAVAQRALQDPSTQRPTAMCAPRAPSCSSSSAWTTRSATATASSPCSVAPRSITTARPHASPLPSGQAQQDVFRAALRRAGVEPAVVGMIEAHGTGTRAGDLVELGSLTSVYGDGDSVCALGSVKTNLGHAEAAAGVIGLLLAVLAVDPARSPRRCTSTGCPPSSSARRAGCSSRPPRPPGRGRRAADRRRVLLRRRRHERPRDRRAAAAAPREPRAGSGAAPYVPAVGGLGGRAGGRRRALRRLARRGGRDHGA